jgi:hypothetical protein
VRWWQVEIVANAGGDVCTKVFLLLLNLVQTANNPDRVLWRRRQQIRITRLARDQDLDVGQAELFPFVLVFERGISGFEDLVFAGRHDGAGSIVVTVDGWGDLGE